MRNKRRDSGHSKKRLHKRTGRDRQGRRDRPKSHRGPKHQRELEKRLRRTGQPVFGEEDE